MAVKATPVQQAGKRIGIGNGPALLKFSLDTAQEAIDQKDEIATLFLVRSRRFKAVIAVVFQRCLKVVDGRKRSAQSHNDQSRCANGGSDNGHDMGEGCPETADHDNGDH